MALARTGNVDVNNLYSFLANDTNAVNNVIAIGGQAAATSFGLAIASFVYVAFRGSANPNLTDFQLDSIVNDLTRDQTAAQNIVLTLGYASMISAIYFTLAQLGEPANRRRIFEDVTQQFGNINRQAGFNPLDFIFGFLDGQLSYANVLRIIVFTSLGAFGIILFWALMSFLPNTPPGKRRRRKRDETEISSTLEDEEHFYTILEKIHKSHFRFSS